MEDNTLEIPIFTSFSGQPINFKVACVGSKKELYLNLIKKYGGVAVKSGGRPRLILFGNGLPCEKGHPGCQLHPQFSAEPAFRIEWIDDCLKSLELLDIKCYALNPSPTFSRIDYMARIKESYYAPVPREPDCSMPANPGLPIDFNIDASSYEYAKHKDRLRDFLCPPKPQSPNVSVYSSSDEETGPVAVGTKSELHEVSHMIESQPSSTPRVNNFRKEALQLLPTSSAQSTQGKSSNVAAAVVLPLSQETDILVSPRIDSQLLAKCFERPVPQTPIELGINDSCSEDESAPLPVATGQREQAEATTQRPPSLVALTQEPPHATERRKGKYPQAGSEATKNLNVSTSWPSTKQRSTIPTKMPYTRQEERAMLEYIKASGRLTGLRSNVIWREMETHMVNRTYQSLKNHFLKYLLPHLERFNIFSLNEIAQMRTT